MTKLTNRDKAKARTRARIIAKARDMFATSDYHTVTIRHIAKAIRMTTGAIFGHFTGKEQLFTEAMGFPPPVDGPLTRAAPMLLEALREAIDIHDFREGSEPTPWTIEARHALYLATSPLDGEAWARHLSSIRRDEPHTLAAGEPAALDPSDAAGDL